VRQAPEFFGQVELPLLYIAKKLKEALKLEKILTDENVDYLVETDTYKGGIIFQSERVGAFFYVAAEELERAREVSLRNGYKPYKTEG
jgi:hypothetical protein